MKKKIRETKNTAHFSREDKDGACAGATTAVAAVETGDRLTARGHARSGEVRRFQDRSRHAGGTQQRTPTPSPEKSVNTQKRLTEMSGHNNKVTSRRRRTASRSGSRQGHATGHATGHAQATAEVAPPGGLHTSPPCVGRRGGGGRRAVDGGGGRRGEGVLHASLPCMGLRGGGAGGEGRRGEVAAGAAR